MTADRKTAIVYAVDEPYALPAAVSGRSAQDNIKDVSGVAWYVLDMGLSDKSRDLIVQSWPKAHSVEFIHVDDEALRGLPATECNGVTFPAQVFGYLLAPGILWRRHERIVTLDADLLAVQDITPLLDHPLSGRVFGAVRDWAFVGAGLQSVGQRYAPDRQLNSGVMVIDSAAWCRERVTERVFEFARTHDDLRLPDQDSVNAVAQHDWLELGYEWNFQMARTVVREYRGPLPRILHFGGLRKPWLGRCSLPHHLRLYRAYARRTAFADLLGPDAPYPFYKEDDGN